MAKHAAKSKTEWVNGLVIALTGASLLLSKEVIPMPPQYQVLVLAIVNAVLRFFTHDSITLKKEDKIVVKKD